MAWGPRGPAPVTTETPPTRVESALMADRWTAPILLLLVPAACWVWIAVMARDMYGPMTGASRWMMTASWDATHLALLWAMWTVMMIGMMLPTAAAFILVYGAATRRSHGGHAAPLIYTLALGYVAVWALYSVAATAAQRLLAALLVLSPMMEVTLPFAAAALLIAAGLYQFTPLKRACLRSCQSPLGFLMSRWRAGRGGAFRLGFEHGLHCVGCCWALMLLLFVGGVMNLPVIAALTALVAVEKSAVLGQWGSRAAGVALLAMGLWTAASVL